MLFETTEDHSSNSCILLIPRVGLFTEPGYPYLQSGPAKPQDLRNNYGTERVMAHHKNTRLDRNNDTKVPADTSYILAHG
jgi:hypothetical protein